MFFVILITPQIDAMTPSEERILTDTIIQGDLQYFNIFFDPMTGC